MQTSIILSHPQLGENVGFVARAMKNFGFSDLRIVNPRDGWPNPKAEATAAHALDLIANAKIYDSIKSAIADLEYLYATTANTRHINKKYIDSSNLIKNYPIALKVGILFGRESVGLINDEMNYANQIITINTSQSYNSLNLGMAACLICYEIFKLQSENSKELQIKQYIQDIAKKSDIDLMLEDLFAKLDTKGFFKVSEKTITMQRNISNIFTRIENLSKSEVQTLRGIIKSLHYNSQK